MKDREGNPITRSDMKDRNGKRLRGANLEHANLEGAVGVQY